MRSTSNTMLVLGGAGITVEARHMKMPVTRAMTAALRLPRRPGQRGAGIAEEARHIKVPIIRGHGQRRRAIPHGLVLGGAGTTEEARHMGVPILRGQTAHECARSATSLSACVHACALRPRRAQNASGRACMHRVHASHALHGRRSYRSSRVRCVIG